MPGPCCKSCGIVRQEVRGELLSICRCKSRAMCLVYKVEAIQHAGDIQPMLRSRKTFPIQRRVVRLPLDTTKTLEELEV